MNKPEYSDLYKFIVSIGVILLALAIILPWLFLRESFNTEIKASDITELTQTAQTLIVIRQNTALWFVQNLIWISLIPAISGFVLLTGGLFLWQRKQKILDQKDVLETEKLKLEIKKMSPEQIAAKAINEVAQESLERLPEEEKAIETQGQLNAIQEYFRVEDMVTSKLSKCFGAANIHSHQKVADTQVDIILRINNLKRAIFEIKRITNPAHINRRRREIVELLTHAVHSYNKIAPEREVYGIGIIIISEDNSRDNDFQTKDNVFRKPISDFEITIITYTESEFMVLECSELVSTIRNATKN
jgi:hypothetical protein